MEHRGFKGIWIPAEIWLDTNLTTMEKLFLVEIDSLDNEDGCFASNNKLGEFFQISGSRASQIISSLEKKGLISVQLFYENKTVTKRVIRVLNKLNTPFNLLGGGTKYSKGGYLENCEDNKQIINKQINNINNNMRKSPQTVKNDFEVVWKEYPNKKGKSKAFSAYQKAIADGVSHDIILQGVKSYAKDCQNKRTKPEYIAHGSTWFGQRRWEDEYDTKTKEFKFSKNNTKQSQEPSREDLIAYQELMKEGGFNV